MVGRTASFISPFYSLLPGVTGLYWANSTGGKISSTGLFISYWHDTFKMSSAFFDYENSNFTPIFNIPTIVHLRFLLDCFANLPILSR